MADNKAAVLADKHVAIPGMFDLEPSVPSTGPVIVNRAGAPCNQATVNCQELGATNQGSLSSDRVENVTGTAGFYTQDDVTFAAAGTLTNLCFWGTYQTPATAPTPEVESFDIIMYADAGGFPGAVLYQASVSQATGLARAVAAPGPANYFVWTLALPADPARPNGLNVAANECRWLQINGSAATLAADRWRWATDSAAATSPNRNRVIIQFGHDDPAGVGADTDPTQWVVNETFRISGFDTAFCFSQALAPNQCILPPVANARCSTATPAVINGPVVSGSTARGLLIDTPFCQFNPVNAPTVWYSVNSPTTQTLTARTCGAGTNFDTVLNVYCGTCTGDNNSGLNCVANNDTGPATCTGTGANADPSEVTWVASAGVTYYVALYGFQITTGTYDFSVSGAGDSPAAVACVSDRCPVTLPAVVEPDACGASTNSAANCNGGALVNFNFGVPFGGTSYNVGTSRDFDFWELADAVPDTTGNGTAWIDVIYSVEFPGLFNFFNGACAANNGTFLGGAFAVYTDGGPACPRDVAARTIQLEVPSGMGFRINLLPVDFGGVPCAPGNNNYSLSVNLSTVRACCVPATACFLTIADDCATQGGTFLASATTCTPTDPCSAPVQGACCRGTTCGLDTSANCTGANTAYKGDSTVCGAGNTNAGCCKADYNQSGAVTVQDIFDFLAGYFSGNPQADINGGGISVQDIFDYLAAYFSGCT